MTDLERQYRTRREKVLVPLAEKLETILRGYMDGVPRIDRISARAKGVDRFLAKATKTTDDGSPKYTDPLNQIQDQIGARIITFYLKDVEAISLEVMKYFRAIEHVTVVPESEREFDYVGKHFILFFPSELFDDAIMPDMAPQFFELQIKTLFQHSWSEANHDLGYKPNHPLTMDQKRRIAFTSAQAWGADRMFDDLHTETMRAEPA